MKRKILPLFALVLALTSCGAEKTEEKEEKPTPIEGPVDTSGRTLVNGFENYNDLMMIRQIIAETNRDSRVDIDINHNSDFVKYGTGSLKVQYIAGTHGDLFQRIDMTPSIIDKDYSDLKEFTCYVYNANDVEKKATISIYKEEHEVLFSEKVDLLPNTWNECKIELNKVILRNSYEHIQGFALGLPRNIGDIDTYYVDQFAIDFGVTETEEDRQYEAKIEEISKRIEALPKEFTLEDTETIAKIEKIMNDYSAIPSIYRSSLLNYSKIETLLEFYINLKANTDKSKNNAVVLNYDTCFGLAQANEDYTSNELEFSYSTDVHYGFEKGSLAVTCSEVASASGWNSFNIVPAYDWSQFDTITFSVYADIDYDLGFCVTWDKFSDQGSKGLNVQTAHKWVTYNYPAKNFSKGGEQINMVGLSGDQTVMLKGTIYFSAFVGRKPTFDYIEFLTNQFPSLEDIVLEDEQYIQKVRDAYESLSAIEKAKVPNNVLTKLEQYEDKIRQLSGTEILEVLPGLIEKIPVKEHYNEAEFSVIYEAYEGYKKLPDANKQTFDADLKSKLLTAVSKYEADFIDRGISLNPSLSNIDREPSWDAKASNINVTTEEGYGNVWKFDKENIVGENTLSTALEIKIKGLRFAGYSKIRFWVKADKFLNAIWCSNKIWAQERIDNNLYNGIAENTWCEVTLNVSDLNSDNFLNIIFVVDEECSLMLTAIEGIK